MVMVKPNNDNLVEMTNVIYFAKSKNYCENIVISGPSRKWFMTLVRLRGKLLVARLSELNIFDDFIWKIANHRKIYLTEH